MPLSSPSRIGWPLGWHPFAAKDNIGAAGWPTTAACPAFGYTAVEDATTVRRLRAIASAHSSLKFPRRWASARWSWTTAAS